MALWYGKVEPSKFQRLNVAMNIVVKRYTGQILMNLMDGKGDFMWPNGDLYSGQYINGRRNGVGDMAYGDGDVYKGAWRNGQYHGQGQYQW